MHYACAIYVAEVMRMALQLAMSTKLRYNRYPDGVSAKPMEIMDYLSLTNWLPVAFGLGLVHALDVDHVVAVAGMSESQKGYRGRLKLCAHWALGHGITLAAMGVAVFALGISIPTRLSSVAESMVGLLLLVMGGWIMVTRRGVLPNTLLPYANAKAKLPGRNQSAMLVGILHGLAGSAPLLLLLPLGSSASPWLGVFYLLVFAGGVLLAMVSFGGFMSMVYRWFAQGNLKWVSQLRLLMGAVSLLCGCWLLSKLFAMSPD